MTKLQVLGAGCPKCRKLAENARAAADEMEIEYDLEKVTDLREIAQAGVTFTPAFVVDGEVKVTGRVPDVDEIKGMLR